MISSWLPTQGAPIYIFHSWSLYSYLFYLHLSQVVPESWAAAHYERRMTSAGFPASKPAENK